MSSADTLLNSGSRSEPTVRCQLCSGHAQTQLCRCRNQYGVPDLSETGLLFGELQRIARDFRYLAC